MKILLLWHCRSSSEIYETVPTDGSLGDDLDEPLSPGFPDDQPLTPSDDSDIYSHIDNDEEEQLVKPSQIKKQHRFQQGKYGQIIMIPKIIASISNIILFFIIAIVIVLVSKNLGYGNVIYYRAVPIAFFYLWFPRYQQDIKHWVRHAAYIKIGCQRTAHLWAEC